METIADVLRHIEEKPDDAELFQRLGLLYRKQGLMDQALSAYERSLSLDPCDPFTHLYLGNWFYTVGDYAMALERFEYATNLMPKEAVCYWCQANVYEQQGLRDLADAFYRRAVEVDPSDCDARYRLRRWQRQRLGEPSP